MRQKNIKKGDLTTALEKRPIKLPAAGECIATVDEKLPFGIVAFNAQLRQCSGDIDVFTDRLGTCKSKGTERVCHLAVHVD